MLSFALFVIVIALTFPAICRNQELVCIKNSESSDSASDCVYRGNAGEKGQKGDTGEVNDDLVKQLRGKINYAV